MNTISAFADWLKQRRRALGLTQETLAHQVGCATITIQKLEAGTLRPSVQIAERLADSLQLAADERLRFLEAARSTSTPVREPEPRRAALPIPLTPLIGRDPFVAAVCALVARADVRLVTLLGPPGVGKTRVALQVAHALQPTFRDGVVFVALASVRDPDLVLATIAQTLGLPDSAEQTVHDQLTAALRSRARLLVLDNVEQVLDAAPAIGALLEAAPALTLCITSRAALHIAGEHEVLVPPLALPDVHQLPSIAELGQVPAVALFVQRAQAVVPEFALSATNAEDVAAICQRLDGLPLALELAAARMKLFAPAALLAHVQHPLAVLTNGARNLPAHQQTLRSAVTWSYDLLSPVQQTLFARLSVFAGGFTSDAVSTICADPDDPPFRVLDDLALLVDHSLVQHALSTAGEVRLSMLETMREYALEHLAQRQEVDSLGERHAHYYMQFAEQADAELRGSQQLIWFDRLEQEHTNVRTAMTWSLQHDVPAIGLRLVGALYWFWIPNGHAREGYTWGAALLPQLSMVAPEMQMKALVGVTSLAWYLGQAEPLVALLEQRADLSRRSGNARDIALAWSLLAVLAAYRGEHESAAIWHRRSLELMRERDDRWGLAVSLGTQGVSAFNLEQFDQAETCLTEALAIFRELGDVWSPSYASVYLGLTLVQQTKYQLAEQVLMDGLRLIPVLGMRFTCPEALIGLAAITFSREQITRAVQFLGAAETLRQEFGTYLAPTVRSILTGYVARARVHVDEATFAQAWEAGRAMSLEQAIAFALGSDQIER